MPNIVMSKLKNQPTDKVVRLKIFDFLDKLAADDSAYGLRVKKMNNAVDPRARTARIDNSWRAVLYLLEDKNQERTWVFAGAWEHDVAIERARTLKVSLNGVNGAVELIASTMPPAPPTPPNHAYGPSSAVASQMTESFLSRFNYSASDLTSELGFDEAAAHALLAARSEEDVLAIAEAFENAWEQNAGLSLATGEPIGKIREELGLEKPEEETGATEDERILRALGKPISKMQFTFVDDNDELRRIIEDGDFAAWRVFVHPEQAKYATGDYNGPFRLSGAAGTGKTVVLLHRARHLARSNPEASIVLTTYTRALAENLKRDLILLDPELTLSEHLGKPGILIRGVDQLAAAVRSRAGSSFSEAAAEVLDAPVNSISAVTGNSDGWAAAIAHSGAALPESLRADAFLEAEYLQVVLPARVTSSADYNLIRRPGRGIALDRRKRIEVWSTIEDYRAAARAASSLSFAESAEIAAAWIDRYGTESSSTVDHILVDEGQDLIPSQWKLLRALAKRGRNDIFIAEDAHQRIYGQHVVLARYGIAIIGRSRRLTLNYRTTAETLAFAVRILEQAEYVDSEGASVDNAGYHPARRGPVPTAHASASDAEQFAVAAEVIEGWLSDTAVDPGSVAVLARTNDRAVAVREALIAFGIPASDAQKTHHANRCVQTMTMHSAKGMEFSRVLLFDVSDGMVPSRWLIDKAPPGERAGALLRERSLLYVAASRARDAVAVTWMGNPSSLLRLDPSTESPDR